MGQAEEVKLRIKLKGVRDIMFNRYPGQNGIELEPEQKVYYKADGKTLCIPSVNIYSLLGAQNTLSVAKRFYGKKWREIALAATGFIDIDPQEIPLTRNGKPIVFKGFDDGKKTVSGIYVHRSVARLKDGIPSPQARPTIKLPWEIEFKLTLYPNDNLTESILRQMFEKGGLCIGLGAYRGVFGKFEVAKWEEIKKEKSKGKK